MTRSALVLLAALVATACAHKQQAQPDELVVKPATPAPAAAQPQLMAAPASPGDDGRELAAALANTALFFDFDSDRLKPEGLDALQRVAKVLRAHPAFAIKIEGNCDERGTAEYNLMLGQRRAEVARKYLVDLGVGPRQVETISYGAERPAAPGHSEAAWAKNRRDDLRVAD